MDKSGSGTEVMDSLLKGGYEKDIITTIYGPSSTGKTCLSMLAAINTLKQDKKVVYIDTEGGFSIERALQIYPDFLTKSDNFIMFKPTSFLQQKQVIEKLKNIIAQNVGLIVVDSIAMYYRLEVANAPDYANVNKDLNAQLMNLLEITRDHCIPVIITNQVYSNMDIKNEVHMVGGDLIRYTCKCIIELKKAGIIRKAIVKKHRAIAENAEAEFKLEEKGVFWNI
jgi:DNA repair protein RadB